MAVLLLLLDRTRTDNHELPAHVEHELRRYVECGVLAHGFVRLRCDDCGKSRTVAFSCKGRGFCPSCTGRRMADTSARLVDDVFPRAPVRQWVLSLPIELRYRLAHDGELLSDVLAVFLRAVRGWYRQQARKAGHLDTRCGCVTFAQRFGSALNLNPHFHTLMLDGVLTALASRCSSTRLYLRSFVDQSPLRFAELQQRVLPACRHAD